MPIRSRGLTPSEFRPLTRSRSEAPRASMATRPVPLSVTCTSVRFTVVVVPVELKGEGCETCGVSVIRTVRLPCAIATGAIFTSWLMTITPFSSLMTTRACWSGTTVSFSISVIRATTPPG